MSIAPTEKHLENWIVNNFDRLEIGSLLGQQVSLPSGIADVVAFDGRCITVVEIKKGNINSACLAQTMRYMHDFENLIMLCHIRLFVNTHSPFYYLPASKIPPCDIITRGVMVGYGLSDHNIQLAANVAEIGIAKYEYEHNSYSIEYLNNPCFVNGGQYNLKLDSFVDSPIGNAVSEIFLNGVAK